MAGCIKLSFSVFLVIVLIAAGPIIGAAAPLYTIPGSFEVRSDGAQASLEILSEQGSKIARYDLADCRFSSVAHEVHGRDGAFELMFHGSAEALIAVICHLDRGGQRLSVFAPARASSRAILEVTGESFVRYTVGLDHLALARDLNGVVVEEDWHPGVKGSESELKFVRDHMKAAKGRRMPEPEPEADPEFQALAAQLTRIAAGRDTEALVALAAPDIRISFGGMSGVEALRDIMTDPDFWPEFDRVLEGGGVLRPGWEAGRAAIFPAAFEIWPEGLDGYGHYYGDRSEAKLRAGPSESAPLLADLYRRIVADGPHLQGAQRLYEAGWLHVCTVEEGCGFARAEQMRSPIDWRAIFTQTAEGEPWVLETYIAGD